MISLMQLAISRSTRFAGARPVLASAFLPPFLFSQALCLSRFQTALNGPRAALAGSFLSAILFSQALPPSLVPRQGTVDSLITQRTHGAEGPRAKKGNPKDLTPKRSAAGSARQRHTSNMGRHHFPAGNTTNSDPHQGEEPEVRRSLYVLPDVTICRTAFSLFVGCTFSLCIGR